MTNPALRLRVFAGPNGSGKSTIINAVRNHQVKGIPVDFGVYVNADEIAQILREGTLSFSDYSIITTRKEFKYIALASGLIGNVFSEQEFNNSFVLAKNCIRMKKTGSEERLAQIIADFLRKKLLQERKKFSFETVFSHPSKLQFMQDAVSAGYKVYLYFVSTEDPDINVYRVKQVRVAEGGHDVPEDKIESRYFRSLELLYAAAQMAYQVYFFDNSRDGEEFSLFAHFKVAKGEKRWSDINVRLVPRWFVKYYSRKIK